MRIVTTTAASTSDHHRPQSPPALKALWERFAFTRRAKKDVEEQKGPHPPYPSPASQNVVFGKPLKDSLKYASVHISTANANGELYVWGYLPVVVAKSGLYLKERATEIEGTFLIDGSNERMRDLQSKFESPPRYGKDLNWKDELFTPHDVASVFRRYLTQLPETVIPFSMYHDFRNAIAKKPYNQDEVIATYKRLIRSLPRGNQYLLVYLLDLLSVFAFKSDKNLMTPANLAVIFSPAVLSHPDYELQPKEHTLGQEVLEFLIAHQDWFMLDIPPPPPTGAGLVGSDEEGDAILTSDEDTNGGGQRLIGKADQPRITRRTMTGRHSTHSALTEGIPATMTRESEHSKYSGGIGPSPSQRVLGTFFDPGEANAVPNPTSDMKADGYDTPSDSGDGASQDSDSSEGKLKSSFVPPRQGLAKPQAQQYGWVESSSSGPVDTTTPVSESACGRLIRRAFALHELPSLVEAIFLSDDVGDTIHCLIGEDAQIFVDVIDEALNMPELPPQIRKKCLKLLYRTCGRHAILPRTLKIQVRYNQTSTALYRGGFADVWKGEHCGRDVAVKVIRTYSNDDLQKIVGKFCKEVVTWKTLRHPNVLPLIGVMMSETQFATVSDWMVNGNINDFVKAHPDADRLGLLEDVAWGLIYIHGQGMIHGDLKGVNILIDQTGHARLADFGLLTIIKDPTNLLTSTTYTQGGSARWMSPELINPQQFGLVHSYPTEFSDCYALGMVIYETISGNPPFHGDTDTTVIVKVIQGKCPPRGSKFRKDLWRMLERCWESQPSGRPSIGEVLRCLETLSNSP